jgi:hypothetical protein
MEMGEDGDSRERVKIRSDGKERWEAVTELKAEVGIFASSLR